MKSIVVIFSILLLSSCVTQKKCLQKFPPTVTRDSIYVETIKDVPVYLSGDTVKIETPINCPDQDLVKYENTRLKQQISILNGKLVSNTQIKPDTIIVKVPEVKITVKEVKVPQPIKFIPKLYSIALWLWAGVFLAIIGYVSLRLLKK